MTKSTALQTMNMPVLVGSLDAYIQKVNQVPMLTAEEEYDLATRLQNQGDLEAAKRLVMSHLRFVVRIARGFQGYGLGMADLIQEGNIGLMKAVKRFDPKVGVRLVSFAVHWIKAEMHEFIIRNWRLVKIATTKAQRKLFFNLRKARKRLGWLGQDEVQAVAKDLNVSEAEVLRMESRLNGRDESFSNPMPSLDSEQAFAPEDYLADDRYDPARQIEAADLSSNRETALIAALNKLDSRSQEILQKRWLTDKKATLHELAAEYQVSAERIRQLEKNAINKLKASMVL